MPYSQRRLPAYPPRCEELKFTPEVAAGSVRRCATEHFLYSRCKSCEILSVCVSEVSEIKWQYSIAQTCLHGWPMAFFPWNLCEQKHWCGFFFFFFLIPREYSWGEITQETEIESDVQERVLDTDDRISAPFCTCSMTEAGLDLSTVPVKCKVP